MTEKDNVKKGLKRRFIILFSFLVSAAFLAGAALLLPSYLLTRGDFIAIELRNSSFRAREESSSNILNLPAEINAKMKLFEVDERNIKAIDAINLLLKEIPPDLTIDSLSFIRGETFNRKPGTKIAVSGVATNRDALVSFANSLKSSGSFSSVEVPVSSLTKDKDLPFSINIFINDQK